MRCEFVAVPQLVAVEWVVDEEHFLIEQGERPKAVDVLGVAGPPQAAAPGRVRGRLHSRRGPGPRSDLTEMESPDGVVGRVHLTVAVAVGGQICGLADGVPPDNIVALSTMPLLL